MKDYLIAKQFIDAGTVAAIEGWDEDREGSGVFALEDGVLHLELSHGSLFSTLREIIEFLGYGERYCFPLKNSRQALDEFGEKKVGVVLFGKLTETYGRVVFLDEHPEPGTMTIILDGVEAGVGGERTSTSHAWARLNIMGAEKSVAA